MRYKKRKPVHVACTGCVMKKIYYEKEKFIFLVRRYVFYDVSIGCKYEIDMFLL